MKYQNDFLDKKSLELFYKKPELGFPLVLPKGIACFDYKKTTSSSRTMYVLMKKAIYDDYILFIDRFIACCV